MNEFYKNPGIHTRTDEELEEKWNNKTLFNEKIVKPERKEEILMFETDAVSKYRPFLDKIKLFDKADRNGNGTLEKINGQLLGADYGEFCNLLALYEESYPSDSARIKNNTLTNKLAGLLGVKPNYVGEKALAEFRKDTGIYFLHTEADGTETELTMIDLNEVDRDNFIIRIDGKPKVTWTVEELFKIP